VPSVGPRTEHVICRVIYRLSEARGGEVGEVERDVVEEGGVDAALSCVRGRPVTAREDDADAGAWQSTLRYGYGLFPESNWGEEREGKRQIPRKGPLVKFVIFISARKE